MHFGAQNGPADDSALPTSKVGSEDKHSSAKLITATENSWPRYVLDKTSGQNKFW